MRCGNCGLSFPVMFPPIMRAKKDFTKIKGTRVSLLELISAVRDVKGVYQFQVVLDKEVPGDEFSRDFMTIRLAVEGGFDPGRVSEDVKSSVKGRTEVAPDRVVIVEDRDALESELFERTGIKAEYVVEKSLVHL